MTRAFDHKGDHMPDITEHDPLDQLAEPSELEQEEVEQGADASEVRAAEESAVNIDTEVATEATNKTALTDQEKEGVLDE